MQHTRFHLNLLRWFGGFLFVLGLSLLGNAARAQPAHTPGIQLAAQDRLGIVETLRGILGYVRWPVEPNPIRVCVLGSNMPATKLLRTGLQDLGERKVQVFQPESEVSIAQYCNVVFVAANSPLPWRKVLEPTAGQPVLTLCERSPACGTGSMFYLDISPQDQVQFEVDIDAVARSGVRVNPQVLWLGHRPGGGHS